MDTRPTTRIRAYRFVSSARWPLARHETDSTMGEPVGRTEYSEAPLQLYRIRWPKFSKNKDIVRREGKGENETVGPLDIGDKIYRNTGNLIFTRSSTSHTNHVNANLWPLFSRVATFRATIFEKLYLLDLRSLN